MSRNLWKAFEWKIQPPDIEVSKALERLDEPQEIKELLKNLPREVPIGSAKQIDLEFGVRGEVVLLNGETISKTSPILFDVEPWDAGLKGQPRLSKRRI